MPAKFRKPNRGRRALPVTLPAPTGGLNGRDNYTNMPPTDAFQLDNWFPSGTSCITRGGSLNYATGIPSAVESLEIYAGGASQKMLAFANGSIYDVTLAGAVGAPLLSGRSSNQVKTAMFSNAGAQFLLVYSGADAPLSYDGTTMTALVITGTAKAQANLFSGMAFKGRVFLLENGTMGFYYLAVGAIQAAASFFDLQQQCLKGGSIVVQTAVSADSQGAGPQDYAVFVSSEGEYLMYAGTDPSNAATWALAGRFYGPKPIGKNSYFKFRSDTYFITEEGILSLTQIRQLGEDIEDESYITAKLGRLFTDQVLYRDTHGWTGFIYPRGSCLMVNVPLSGAETGGYEQFVMNTNTNAWCRYLNLNGISWTVFGGRLYFGTSDGKVVLADEGFTDNNIEIRAIGRQAWNAFDDGEGMGDADKQFHFATFAMQADGAPAISCAMNVNYEDDAPTFATPFGTTAGAEWDTATWDLSDWAGSAAIQNITVPVGKIGYIASAWVQATSIASRIQWYATRVTFEKSKGILLQ